ncbi:MAG: FadR family transcriptional regulator [Hyphomicrobiales bacterium]|nr:FadR family transcriptional regulator [Hyphomicrobiales bacterium]
MIFQKIKNPKIAEAIVSQIEDLIVQGVLRPGDQLPAERDLALTLDVSRPSLRDAIKELEKRGLLRTRRGGGTFVGDVIGSIFAEEFVYLFRSNDRAIADYIEFRKEIDVIAARHAAERSTDADKKILTRIHDQLCRAFERGDNDRIIKCDTEFHIAVVAAAHNVVLLHTLRSILEQMVPIFYKRLPREPEKAMVNDIVAQHGAILQAIIDRDADAAQKAVETHGDFIEATLRDADYAYWRENTAERRLEMLSREKTQPRRSGANDKPAGTGK